MLPPRARRAIRKASQLLLGFSITRGNHDDSEFNSDEDLFVWDVLDPFAPQDPADERLRNLIQAEIAHMRRYESIGPLQSLPREDDYDDSSDSEDWSDSDADADADADDEDDGETEDEPERPTMIALPRLLHTRPLCQPFPSRSPSPSPSLSSADHEDPFLDLTEAEEQERVRKEKRDAHRSRLKALAILGPEAISALKIM